MIALLLDQGVRHPVAQDLRDLGWDVVHTQDINLRRALDEEILSIARETGRVVVTLDSDFSTLLALSGATGPSVVFIRIPRLSRVALRNLLVANLPALSNSLRSGCVATIAGRGVRVRALPIGAGRR